MHVLRFSYSIELLICIGLLADNKQLLHVAKESLAKNKKYIMICGHCLSYLLNRPNYFHEIEKLIFQYEERYQCQRYLSEKELFK